MYECVVMTVELNMGDSFYFHSGYNSGGELTGLSSIRSEMGFLQKVQSYLFTDGLYSQRN